MRSTEPRRCRTWAAGECRRDGLELLLHRDWAEAARETLGVHVDEPVELVDDAGAVPAPEQFPASAARLFGAIEVCFCNQVESRAVGSRPGVERMVARDCVADELCEDFVDECSAVKWIDLESPLGLLWVFDVEQVSEEVGTRADCPRLQPGRRYLCGPPDLGGDGCEVSVEARELFAVTSANHFECGINPTVPDQNWVIGCAAGDRRQA